MIALIVGDKIYELRPPSTGEVPQGFLAAVSDGMRSMWRIAALRSHVLASVIYVAGWGTLVVGFPLYAESVHARAAASGYLWAAISLGSLLSAFVFRNRALRLDPNLLIVGSFAAMGLSVLLWPMADTLVGALALVALTGALEVGP